MSEKKDKEVKDIININQPVDRRAYSIIKAYAGIQKRPIPEIVNEAILEKAARIKL